MKIAAFLITGLVNGTIGGVLFFFLLLGLNGFSEQQATPGLILYIAWVLIASIIMAILSLWLTNYLTTKKSVNNIVAGLISIGIFIVVGTVSTLAALFGSVLIVSVMR